jgi:predicted ATPase
MKIKLKNLGAIKQAEFEIGDLTIICGTGKISALLSCF